MLFKWRDAFRLDIPEIDAQHQKLFEIGSRLYEIISLGDKYDHYDEIMQIIDELRDYAKYHFSYEENLMREKNFEGYDTHKVEHNLFIKRIAAINVEDIEEDQNKVLLDMVTFIADWISGHILKTDRLYREILK